jgi:hypothetical protein
MSLPPIIAEWQRSDFDDELRGTVTSVLMNFRAAADRSSGRSARFFILFGLATLCR